MNRGITSEVSLYSPGQVTLITRFKSIFRKQFTLLIHFLIQLKKQKFSILHCLRIIITLKLNIFSSFIFQAIFSEYIDSQNLPVFLILDFFVKKLGSQSVKFLCQMTDTFRTQIEKTIKISSDIEKPVLGQFLKTKDNV